MVSLLADLRHALRVLIKSPGFTIAALAAIALGIGANTAIFTVINAVLLHPLPYPDSDRIVSISRVGGGTASPPMYAYWQQNNPCFDDLSAYTSATGGQNLTGGDRPELVQSLRVSKNYFRLFGANPILGRVFTAEEDRPGGPQALVMSFGLWQRRFGGDPSIVGKTLTVGSVPYPVAGVLSPHFQSYPPADVFVPLQADPNSTNQARILTVAGRLRNGVTLAGANAQMGVLGKRYTQTHPDSIGNDDKVRVTPLQQALTGDVRPALLILFGAVGLVLLIACANVANLLLARSAGRQREIAIRAAVGAGRGRIIRQLLTESLLLATTGGLLGLALGSAGLRALLALTPGNLPRAEELAAVPALDPWIAGFTLLLSLFTGVVFGLVPAIQVSHTDLAVALKDSGGRTGTSLKQNRTRGVLVTAEMALAVVLLCGAVLLIRSFVALHNVDPGFDPRNVLTMKLSLADARFAKSAAVDRMARQMIASIEQIPGVSSAAIANSLPLEDGVDMIFNIPGRPVPAGQKFSDDVSWRFITPHYFDVLKVPLRAGRMFREQEPKPTVIINEALARKHWPRESAIGKTILLGAGLGPDFDEGSVEIVGVVANVREGGLDNEVPEVMYQMHSQIPDAAMKLVNGIVPSAVLLATRPGVPPTSVSKTVEQQFLSSEFQLPPTQIRTMDQVSLNSTARQNFNLALLGAFAGIALLLAAVGIYGVMSYAVEQRTHEIGIRAALGASDRDTLRLVLGEGLRLALIGVLAGLAAAFGLTRFMTSQLFGVKPSDPITFVAVALILLSVAFLATCVPAVRASRVDPIVALRYE
jgi:putative ABC transport system permease protein